jgi:hypothetical protein
MLSATPLAEHSLMNACPIDQLLSADGYALLRNFLSDKETDDLTERVSQLGDGYAGNRRLLDMPWCAHLGERVRMDRRLQELLAIESRTIQCTLFVKSAARNWLVALHQDLSIPVAERVDSPACSGWSQKEGNLFVQPPIVVLEQIVAIRLHLDDCDEQNGGLRVVPRSHRLGRLNAGEALRARDENGEVSVPMTRGGAIVMKPLLLHASSKATIHSPRRVLHFVFGPQTLPEGLRWPCRNHLSTAHI